LLEFINDEDYRNKILNTKTTTYEELWFYARLWWFSLLFRR
jgi:hypothetical protein